MLKHHDISLPTPEEAEKIFASITPEQQKILDAVTHAYETSLDEIESGQDDKNDKESFATLFEGKITSDPVLSHYFGPAADQAKSISQLAQRAAALRDDIEKSAALSNDNTMILELNKVYQTLEAQADRAAKQQEVMQPPKKKPETNTLSRREWVKTAGLGGAALLGLSWLGAGFAATKTVEAVKEGTKTAAIKIEQSAPKLSGQNSVNIVDAATMAYFLGHMGLVSTGKVSGIRPIDYAVMSGFLAARCAFGGQEIAEETTHTLSHAGMEAGAIIVFSTAVEGIKGDLSKTFKDMPHYKDDITVRLAANFAAASSISPFFSTITTSAALQDELETLFFENKQGKLNKLLASIAVEHHANMSGATGIDGDPPTFHNIGKFGVKGAVALQFLYGMPVAAYSLVSGLYKANLAVLLGPDVAMDTFKNPAKWITLDPSLSKQAWDNTSRGLSVVGKYMPGFIGHSVGNLVKYAANPITGFITGERFDEDPRGMNMMIGQRLHEASSNMFQVLAHADPKTKHEFNHGAHITSQLLKEMGRSITEAQKTQLEPFASRLEGILTEAGQQVQTNLDRGRASLELFRLGLQARSEEERLVAYKALSERATKDLGTKGQEVTQILAGLHVSQNAIADAKVTRPTLEQSNPLAVARRITEERLELGLGPAVYDAVKTIGYQTMALPALQNTIGIGVRSARNAGMPDIMQRSLLLMTEWQISKDADNWAAHSGIADGAAKEGMAIYGSSTNMAINGGGKKEDGNPASNKKIVAATRGFMSRQDVASGTVHIDSTFTALGYSLTLDTLNAEKRLMQSLNIPHPVDTRPERKVSSRQPA